MLPPAKQMRSTKCIAPFDSWSQTGKYFSKTSGRFNMLNDARVSWGCGSFFAAWILPYIFVLSSFVVQIVPNLIMLMMLLRTKIRETKLRWPAKIKFKFAGCQKSWGNQTWVGDFIWLKLSFVNNVWGRWGQGDQSCCLSQYRNTCFSEGQSEVKSKLKNVMRFSSFYVAHFVSFLLLLVIAWLFSCLFGVFFVSISGLGRE